MSLHLAQAPVSCYATRGGSQELLTQDCGGRRNHLLGKSIANTLFFYPLIRARFLNQLTEHNNLLRDFGSGANPSIVAVSAIEGFALLSNLA